MEGCEKAALFLNNLLLGRYMKSASHPDDAFRELLARHYGHVMTVAVKLAAISDLGMMTAGDLAHDAILHIWAGRRGYDPRKPFPVWATQAVRTAWLKRLRRLRLERRVEKNLKNLVKNRGLRDI
jgi:RNA polymerase sigma factor (sigma-70 family)